MYNTIVVGTDGSDTARGAVRHAATLAKTFGGKLHLVSAFRPAAQTMLAMAEPTMVGTMPDDQQVGESIRRSLEDQAKALAADGVACEIHVVPDAPASAILEVAESNGADLIVVGNRGMGGARRLLGSVPNSVTHHATCSVLVVDTSH